jgi:hypothetical protein
MDANRDTQPSGNAFMLALMSAQKGGPNMIFFMRTGIFRIYLWLLLKNIL